MKEGKNINLKMAPAQKFCLRWDDFENKFSSAFQDLRENKDFFDVTLACDDQQIEAHKVIILPNCICIYVYLYLPQMRKRGYFLMGGSMLLRQEVRSAFTRHSNTKNSCHPTINRLLSCETNRLNLSLLSSRDHPSQQWRQLWPK